VKPGAAAPLFECPALKRVRPTGETSCRLRLCTECREPYGLPADRLGVEIAGDEVMLYRAVGCTTCGPTGYSGRLAIHELMLVRAEIRGLIERSADELFGVAVRQGIRTLREGGAPACLAGTSSLEEIRPVTGDRLV
jgi:type II secretory ATPase GspE/PulE/Tfp pilus assembly ATPase PilB-like protein